MRCFGIVAVLVAGVVVAACLGGDGEPEAAPTANEPTPASATPVASVEARLDDYVGAWRHDSGGSGPYGTVIVERGLEHCDWDRFLFLSFTLESEERVQFVRAGGVVLPPDWAPGKVVTAVAVPAGAENTGYSLSGATLFLAPDLSSAWVVFETHTERWPRQTRVLICD